MVDVQELQEELDGLIERGLEVRRTLEDSDEKGSSGHELATEYQQWFTESSRIISQILPDRSGEFTLHYSRDEIYSITEKSSDIYYGNQEYARDIKRATRNIRLQHDLLKSAEAIFISSLFDIKAVVQADLFDSEIDAARELLRKGFLRPAGVLAGVVLERHLAQVAANHKLAIRKKNPTISDFNDLLKGGSVVDVPAWRQIQRLGDLRNLCAHNKEREPTKEEVDELIGGADKYTKTLF